MPYLEFYFCVLKIKDEQSVTCSPSETPRQRQWLAGSKRFSHSRRTPKRQQRRKSHREQIRKLLLKQHSSTHVLSAGHRCQTPRLSSSILRELPLSASGTLGRNAAIQLGQLIQLLETDSGYDDRRLNDGLKHTSTL
ncbi:hypothetical protein AMELA_G00248230 [Ameiurus melas]|uniref:Uncharacterized protein n=1 Tax=Ameiurus melas TaxID=219545 RepID=A0A7J5ZTL3_AMEME|nr:hypothetical protein AMELA_G00248230 [Ameiurus melas]